MDIRTEIREIEAYVKTLAARASQQIALLTYAQWLTRDERTLTILAIAKNRIRRQEAR